MRRLLRTALLIATTAGIALVAGCKSPCRQLSEKLCDCSANSVEKENCVRLAQRAESNYKLSDDENKACQVLLDANECDCHLIDTEEGKRKCGLAR